MKSFGKRFILCFTARFKALVSVSYNAAKSLSSITLSPLISYILFWMLGIICIVSITVNVLEQLILKIDQVYYHFNHYIFFIRFTLGNH